MFLIHNYLRNGRLVEGPGARDGSIFCYTSR